MDSESLFLIWKSVRNGTDELIQVKIWINMKRKKLNWIDLKWVDSSIFAVIDIKHNI